MKAAVLFSIVSLWVASVMLLGITGTLGLTRYMCIRTKSIWMVTRTLLVTWQQVIRVHSDTDCIAARITDSVRVHSYRVTSTQTPMQWVAIMAARGVCFQKSGVDEDLVRQVRMGDFSSNDLKLKKYCYCTYKALQLMSYEGNINKEIAINILPEQTDPKKFSNAVEACKNQTGTDRYEKAYNVLKCYNKLYPNDIIVL